MDGIAGIVYPDVFQMNDLILPMIDALKYRCNQDPIVHTHKNIQISACGTQMASNKNQTIFAGIDGNLSNKKDLANELKIQASHASEIILKTYERYGNVFFEKLTGDFAIVILDHTKKQMLLARDRIGNKPLYWFQNSHHFIFASELKAILATGAVPQTPAMDALASYLYFGYIPQDMSPIVGINKLLPAHYLQLNYDGSKSISSYWSYSSYFQKKTRNSKEQIVNTLDSLLKKSIQESLPKENHIGCFISADLGSASIAYYLKDLVPSKNISSYTVGFHGENTTNMEIASDVARSLGNLPLPSLNDSRNLFK